jgi:hypothetical protein
MTTLGHRQGIETKNVRRYIISVLRASLNNNLRKNKKERNAAHLKVTAVPQLRVLPVEMNNVSEETVCYILLWDN